MENIMSKDNFAEDEDLYFHHSHPETLYNVLGKGLMSHGFHDRLHNARSTGSGGGWDRTSKNESKFICFWSPYGYYKHLIDLIKNPRKYINKKVRDDDFVEQFGDFRQLHKSPKEIMNLSDEQKDKLIKEVLSKKENNKTEDKQSILKTFIMPSAFSNGYTAIIKTEEVPYRYMHYDVSSGAEMHFKHRIKPQQIVGIVIKENHGNEEERLNLEFFKKCCKLFSKPIYDENFNLLWPKKMTKEDVSEFVKKRNEDLKVKDGK